MRKNLLLLAFSFSTVASLFGQSDSVLNQFTFRTPRYQALTANAGGGYVNDKTNFTLTTGESRNGSGNLGGGYTLLQSTDRMLLQFSAAAGGSFNNSHSGFSTTTNKNNGASAYGQFNLGNQWFSGQRFLELGAAGSIQTGMSNATQKNNFTTEKTDANNIGYAAMIQLGAGKGRLENITDMQNALWLAKALKEERRLTRELSTDELLLLGRSITKGNNTRVLDSRKQRQYQLQTTDALLQEKGLVSKNDITYFSNLNDVLFFSFNNFRLRGTEKFIRITPSISGGRQKYSNNSNDQQYTTAVKSALFAAGFNRFQPQRLTRQLNYGATVKASHIRHEANSSFFSSGSPVSSVDETNSISQAGLAAFIEQAFYPNTRTAAALRLEAESGYQQANDDNRYYGQVRLINSINYFISYRTRFTAEAGLSYNNNIYTTYQRLELLPENFRFHISAGLQISL